MAEMTLEQKRAIARAKARSVAPIPDVVKPELAIGPTQESRLRSYQALEPAMIAGGGMLGNYLGGAAGTAGGPAAPATVPGGVIVGGGLGAAAGKGIYELGEDIGRMTGAFPPEQEGLAKRTGEMAKEAVIDMAVGAGTAGLGPAVTRAYPALRNTILGIGSEESRRLANLSRVRDVGLGTVHASSRGYIKGIPKVLGVFPFVSTPLRKGQARVVGELDQYSADLLNTLAPYQNKLDMGKALADKAGKRFRARMRIASSLYDDFAKTADNLSNPNIVNTAPLKEALSGISEKAAKEVVPLASGKPMAGMAEDPVGSFINQIGELPDTLTVSQARGLERQLNDAYRLAQTGGYDVSRLGKIKGALEEAKNNLDVSSLPAEEAAAVLDKWNKANRFFKDARKTVETPTGKVFERTDRNIFKATPVEKAGGVNPDEIFSAAFRTKSPEALKDLRNLVGPREFKKASRSYLEGQLQAARKPAKEGGLVEDLFSAQTFKKNMGLDTPEGQAALDEILKGTNITRQDFNQFLDLASAATNITIRDPSSFLARRLVLSGGIGGLAGGMAVGGGKVSIPAAVIITMALRGGSKALMNPKRFRDMARVVDPSLSDHLRNMAATRLVRLSLRDEKQSPQSPSKNQPSARTPQE